MLKPELISSLAELRAAAPKWDDLWLRSNAAWPTLQADALALWSEQFSDLHGFQAVTIQDGDSLIAALPLVHHRLGGLLPMACLTGNAWWPAGDLLVDESSDLPHVLDLLVEALRKHARPLFWCDAIRMSTVRWQALVAALDRAELSYNVYQRGVVGLVDLPGRWEGYLSTRSRNLRRQIRVAEKRSAHAGALELRLIADPGQEELVELLQRGFEVEDRSWKGASGSSVLRSPVMYDYFLRQARLLAERGELILAYLNLGNETIAFEYGLFGKGVYCSLKVGYDERYAELSPGQLLRAKMLEQFCAAGWVRTIDFLGPLVDATARWTTRTHDVSRLVIATNATGRMILAARSSAQAVKRYLRRPSAAQLAAAESIGEPEPAISEQP